MTFRPSMSSSLGAVLLLASAGAALAAESGPAHQLYASSGITCSACHPCGGVLFGGHDAAWMDPASLTFHAVAANRGLASCQSCHGASLDGVGGSVSISCAVCHGANWRTHCTMCHGGVDNPSGAPPRATWGNVDPLASGAHTSHVAGTHGLSLPVYCASCHVTPVDALWAGHADGVITVTGYTGRDPGLLAVVKEPGWNRTSGTCATSYCHGATLQGGTLSTPTWTTLDGTQATCGTCHGIPPPTGRLAQIHNQGVWMTLHDLHVGTGYTCRACHPGYGVDLTPNTSIHVNGTVDVGNWIKQWDPVTGTCSLTSCHGAVVMRWR
jgi:predicted CxxxxCH...CXXCH cytochrome family protein